MAKYDIKFSCGHTEIRCLVGSCSERERKIKYFEDFGLCSECYRNKLLEDRKLEQEEAFKKVEKLGLIDLEGSEKQIAWANQIRIKYINQFNYLKEDKGYKIDKNFEDLFIKLINKPSAKFFIDNRFESLSDILKIIKNEDEEYLKKIRQEELKIEEEKMLELKKEAELEATIFVNDDTSNYAKIVIKDSKIKVFYKYDVLFIEIVKKLGYTYNNKWEMDIIGEIYGNITDRAVELGVTLLENNINVCCLDLNIKEKILNKDFVKRQYRWLILNTENKLKLKDYNYDKNTLYNYYRNKKIRGKWKNKGIIVEVENYRQLLDFCEENKFSITSSAYNFIKNFAGEENMKTTEEVKKDLCDD